MELAVRFLRKKHVEKSLLSIGLFIISPVMILYCVIPTILDMLNDLYALNWVYYYKLPYLEFINNYLGDFIYVSFLLLFASKIILRYENSKT